MACLEMFNTEHQAFCAPLSPRISFSSDFVEAEHLGGGGGGGGGCITNRPVGALASPEDTGFEFSVSNHTMLTADQLFFQGRLLPFKDEGSRSSSGSHGGKKMTTLRDELWVADEDQVPRPPKGSRKWKEILGLKKGSATISRKKNQLDIDVKEERKIWGWREETEQSSYRWYVQEKKHIEEEGEEEEREENQEQQGENQAV